MGFLNLNPKPKNQHLQPQSKREQELKPKPKPTYSPLPSTEDDIAKLQLSDPDHPVHNIPLAKREKMRAKGINPVLRAEMDDATEKGGFWGKIGKHTSNGMAFTFPSV